VCRAEADHHPQIGDRHLLIRFHNLALGTEYFPYLFVAQRYVLALRKVPGTASMRGRRYA